MADDAAITVEEYTRTFRRTRTPLLKQIQEALTEHGVEKFRGVDNFYSVYHEVVSITEGFYCPAGVPISEYLDGKANVARVQQRFIAKGVPDLEQITANADGTGAATLNRIDDKVREYCDEVDLHLMVPLMQFLMEKGVWRMTAPLRTISRINGRATAQDSADFGITTVVTNTDETGARIRFGRYQSCIGRMLVVYLRGQFGDVDEHMKSKMREQITRTRIVDTTKTLAQYKVWLVNTFRICQSVGITLNDEEKKALVRQHLGSNGRTSHPLLQAFITESISLIWSEALDRCITIERGSRDTRSVSTPFLPLSASDRGRLPDRAAAAQDEVIPPMYETSPTGNGLVPTGQRTYLHTDGSNTLHSTQPWAPFDAQGNPRPRRGEARGDRGGKGGRRQRDRRSGKGGFRTSQNKRQGNQGIGGGRRVRFDASANAVSDDEFEEHVWDDEEEERSDHDEDVDLVGETTMLGDVAGAAFEYGSDEDLPWSAFAATESTQSHIQIFVDIMGSLMHVVNVAPSTRISEIAEHLSEAMCIAVEDQVITYKNRFLSLEGSIEELHIPNGATLHLTVKLRGGCDLLSLEGSEPSSDMSDTTDKAWHHDEIPIYLPAPGWEFDKCECETASDTIELDNWLEELSTHWFQDPLVSLRQDVLTTIHAVSGTTAGIRSNGMSGKLADKRMAADFQEDVLHLLDQWAEFYQDQFIDRKYLVTAWSDSVSIANHLSMFLLNQLPNADRERIRRMCTMVQAALRCQFAPASRMSLLSLLRHRVSDASWASMALVAKDIPIAARPSIFDVGTAHFLDSTGMLREDNTKIRVRSRPASQYARQAISDALSLSLPEDLCRVVAEYVDKDVDVPRNKRLGLVTTLAAVLDRSSWVKGPFGRRLMTGAPPAMRQIEKNCPFLTKGAAVALRSATVGIAKELVDQLVHPFEYRRNWPWPKHFITDTSFETRKAELFFGPEYCGDNAGDGPEPPWAFNVVASKVFADVPANPILDSGATRSMSNDAKVFRNLRPPPPHRRSIVVADGRTIPVQGIGDWVITTINSSRGPQRLVVRNSLLVPDIKRPLVSASQLLRDGADVKLDSGPRSRIEIKGKDGAVEAVIPLSHVNNAFELVIYDPDGVPRRVNTKELVSPTLPHANAATTRTGEVSMTLKELHLMTGHVRSQRALLQYYNEGRLPGIRLTSTTVQPCAACAMVKAKRLPAPPSSFATSLRRAGGSEVMSQFASDVKGPISYHSTSKKGSVQICDITAGYVYYISFVDLVSGFSTVYGMRTYDEIVPRTAQFLKRVVKAGYTPTLLRSDNFSNYISTEMRKVLESYNMEQELTLPYCAWMNGQCERLNYTLWSAAATILYHARLEPSFWYLAVIHANTLRNMLPHADGVSPNSRIRNGEVPDGHYLKRLHTFGDDVVALKLPRDKVGSANVKGRIGTWVGHSIHQDAQLVYFPDKRKVDLVYHARVYPGAPFRLNKLSNLMAPPKEHRPPQIQFEDGTTGTSMDASQSDGRDPYEVPYDICEPTVTDDVAEGKHFNDQPSRTLTGRGPIEAILPELKGPGQSDSIGLPEKELRDLEDSYLERPVEQAFDDPATNTVPLVHHQQEAITELPEPEVTGSISDRITKALAHGTRVTFSGTKRSDSDSGRRWASYSKAQTLTEAKTLGCTRPDMKWDLQRGLLQIHDGLGTDQANVVADDPTETVVDEPRENVILESATLSNKSSPTPACSDKIKPIKSRLSAGRRERPLARPLNDSDCLLHDQLCAVLSANSELPIGNVAVTPTTLEALHIANAVSLGKSSEARSASRLPVTNSYLEAKEWQRQGINNGDKWVAAFEAEVDSFKTFNTFLKVRRSDVPKYSTILTGKFTGKVKEDAQGNPTRWKQRWVVRGYQERFSEHFFRTNASTLGTESAFMMFSLAASNGWHLRLIDWANAYQTGEVDNAAMYIQMPRGFEEYDSDGTEFVFQLVGNIYGTRSAGRVFGRFRDTILFELGFVRFSTDRSVFYRRRGASYIFMACFVDDCLTATNDVGHLNEFFNELNQRVTCTMEPVTKFLGMTVTQENGYVCVDNRLTVQKLLETFNLESLGLKDPDSTAPMPTGFDPTSPLAVEDKTFKQYVFLGYLSYLAATTRLDLKAPLNALGQYSTKWNSICTKACKHLARYLASTRTLGLRFCPNDPLANKLVGFSDFGTHTAERSLGGHVIMLNGAAIASKTHTLKGVKTSTSWGEAEALHEAASKMTVLRELIREFGFSQGNLSNPIFCDSQSVLAAVNGEKKLKRSKQYALHVNYLKEKTAAGLIHLRYCESAKQGADIMTKVIFPSILHFTALRNMVMGIAPHTIEQMEKDGKLLLSADETKMVRVQANDSLAPLKATEYFHSSTGSSRAPLTQPHDNSL